MFQIICTLIPLILMTCMTPRLQKRLSAVRFRQVAWLMFLVYLVGNLYFTLLSRVPGSGTVVALTPFRAYQHLFEIVQPGFENATGFVKLFLQGALPITGLILNIMLYYPLGYLLPVLFPRLKTWQIILIGCAASVLTELTQYLLVMGWCETDDVIHNTLGTAVGAAVWLKQSKATNKTGFQPHDKS